MTFASLRTVLLLAFAICSLAIAFCAAVPNVSGSFQAQVSAVVSVRNHTHLTHTEMIYQDMSIKALRVDQIHPGSVFVEELFLFSQGKRYVISTGHNNQYCKEETLHGNMVSMWDWLKTATASGACESKDVFPGNGTLWKAASGHHGNFPHEACVTPDNIPLWVEVNNEKDNMKFLFIIQTWENTVDSSAFQPPAAGSCHDSLDLAASQKYLNSLLRRSVGDAVGCTPAPYGTVCIAIHGHGSYVDNVSVIRSKVKGDMICDYNSAVWGPGYKYVANVHQGCVPLTTYDGYGFNKNFPRGRMCGAFYESGHQQGGDACENIE